MSFEYECPSCQQTLAQQTTTHGAVWRCEAGCGVCVNTSVLRQTIDPGLATLTWMAARNSVLPSARRCPSCRRPLRTFQVSPQDVAIELDACAPCMVLWFDRDELSRMGAQLKARAPIAPSEAASVKPLSVGPDKPFAERAADDMVDAIVGVLDELYRRWG